MGFSLMTTDTTAGILAKVYTVLPGVPTRLRAPKQLVEEQAKVGAGMGVGSQAGFVGGSCSLCNRAGVQGAPGEGLGRESADEGIVITLGLILDFLAPTVKTTGREVQGVEGRGRSKHSHVLSVP